MMAVCPGTYTPAKMKDGWLARLRLPTGTLTVTELLAIARLARDKGNGLVDLTNRANLQIRGLGADKWQEVSEYLVENGLAVPDPDHDRTRNITIDPLSGLAEEILDARPLARALDQALALWPNRGELSPKFSFIIDGGGPSNIIALRHEIGWRAERNRENEVVCRLSVKGHETGYCTSPGSLANATINIIEALVMAGITSGPTLADQIGKDQLEKILSEAAKKNQLINNPAMKQANPFDQTKKKNGEPHSQSALVRLAPSRGTREQLEVGKVAVTLSLRTSQLHHLQLEALAELINNYGNGTLRLTPWQALILPHALTEKLDEIWEKAEAIGLLTQVTEQNLTILACTGCTGCQKAGFETRMKALELRERLSARAFHEPVTVHFSACEKGCASRDAADILLMQRCGEAGMQLYLNAAPSTSKAGIKVSSARLLDEIIEHL